jgi:D-galactarolactone cycloisomerase
MMVPDFLIEYDQTENVLRDKLTFPSLVMKDGMIEVPTGPGLGMDVNEDILKKYSISRSL